MGRFSIAEAMAAADIEVVRKLFREYASSLPIDLEYQNFSEELRTLPGAYSPPEGALLLARVGDEVAGCVGLRRIDSRVCEMKRLYVRPEARGNGVAAGLVEAALARARASGYQEMWLDTLPHMSAAHALYRRYGFHEVPPYGGAAAKGTRYYGVSLMSSDLRSTVSAPTPPRSHP
ncbi:MAG TPA: GNAT family N-acetyltransferase [Burkholderiales bacterium]|nr:GNAT family N-acetyltransferase [Burkholderiales bacterium]